MENVLKIVNLDMFEKNSAATYRKKFYLAKYYKMHAKTNRYLERFPKVFEKTLPPIDKSKTEKKLKTDALCLSSTILVKSRKHL